MLPDLEWGCRPRKCPDFFFPSQSAVFCINFQDLVAKALLRADFVVLPSSDAFQVGIQCLEGEKLHLYL